MTETKKQPLTKKRFESVLEKVFTTPLPELAGRRGRDQAKKRTSASHPSDGCTDTHKSQDNPEGKEG